MRRPTLSLVLPLRNEAEELRDLESHLSAWLSAYEVECEIVLVDDGSTDDTPARVAAWAARDGRVTIVSLLRSYGIEGALRAGLDHASGEAVILIDGDIQDSAEVIPRMVEAWRGGADLVHARRRPTQVERGLKSLLRKSIHELTDSLTRNGVPQDAANFRLVDQSVAVRLKSATPSARNLRGLLGHVARAQTNVTFESIPSKRRQPPTLAAEIDSAFDSITRRSLVPLRLAYGVAALVFFVSVFALLIIVAASSKTAPVRASVWIGAILGVIGGAQLFFIGLIGEYVGRIFLDLQKLPPYSLASQGVVRERALPAAPRMAMPSAESLHDSELEAMPERTHTEPPPPPMRASLSPEASRPPPPALTAVLASPPQPQPQPRLTPPPGQMRAVTTKNTVKLTHEELKAEVARAEVAKTDPPPKIEPGKAFEPIKAEAKAAARLSNPPLPSKRSSVPPSALGSRSRIDAVSMAGRGETKLDAGGASKASATPAAVATHSTPAGAASDRPPPSLMTNAQASSFNARTKTLAGIPLPAMLAYAQGNTDSAPPPSRSSAPVDASGSAKPVDASGSAKPVDVERLKEEPKPLTTLYGVPGADR